MKTKFTFLMDDKPGEALLNEHGLSILIDTGKHRILFDTGQSSRFASNAENLDIDLGTVDLAMISHGHYDHGGGLPAFFERNESAPVWIHSKAALPIYYSTNKGGRTRYVGIKEETFSDYKDRFIFTDSAVTPAEGIHIIPGTDVPGRGPIYKDGSLYLKEGDVESIETFDHEIFMVIEREEDIILISGCSHNNIVAIIKHVRELFSEKRLTAVIGGFHLPDLAGYNSKHESAAKKTAGDLNIIVSEINTLESSLPFYYTGHCTGDRAKVILKEVLGDKIDFFHAGYSFLL
ncbi:MAG TPA: hypothetical protein DCO79_14090 [Spirochaeta sp.]|nr:hypothetical protein [Spirochaeta sp.]